MTPSFASEHEWNDRKWARCNLCGIYADDYGPHETMPECSDKARDNYAADLASDYDEPWGMTHPLPNGKREG